METNDSSQAIPPLIPICPSFSPAVETEDVLDWDFQLEVDASQRRSGVVKAKARHEGRAVPIPLPAPGESQST